MPASSGRPVFVHINKTAGSSVVRSAGRHIVNAGHRRAADWIRENGRPGSLFSVVRHPYERVRSEYTYRRRRWEGGEQNPHLANLRLPFDQWVHQTYVLDAFRTRGFFERTGVEFNEFHMADDVLVWFLPQVRWLCDDDGNMLVDELLRFEHLADEWPAFCARHGFDAPLVHVNASPVSPRVEGRFTAEVRAIIADYFADDFERLGYEP